MQHYNFLHMTVVLRYGAMSWPAVPVNAAYIETMRPLCNQVTHALF